MDCAACDDDLAHCHELVIEHLDGTVECAGGTCDVPADTHRHRAACAELFGRCLCIDTRASVA